MKSISRKLMEGSVLRFITLVANTLVGFFMLPFLVASLGDDQYGLWVLVGSVVGFYGLIDMGMGAAVNRFIVRAIHDEKRGVLNEALSTSMVLFSGFGILSLIITIVIFFATPHIVESSEHITIFQTIFLILGIKVSLLFPLSVYTSVLQAKYRFDLLSYLQLTSLLIRSLCIVYFISADFGLVSLALITSIDAVLASIVTIYIARKLMPNIKISISDFRLERFKEYLHYGKFVYLLNISVNVRASMPNILIGAFITVGAVTHYTIAVTLLTYFAQVITSIFGVVGPVLNKYHKLNQWDDLREVFIVVTELTAVTSVLIGGIIIILGHPFIHIWMGDGYEDVYTVLFILVLAGTVGNALRTNVTVLFAIAKHKFHAQLHMIGTIVISLLGLIFITKYGLNGVALGVLIPVFLIQLILIPVYTCKSLKFSIKLYYNSIIKIFGSGLFIFYCSFAIIDLNKVDSYFELILISVVISAIYLFVVSKLVLSVPSKNRLKELVPAKFRRVASIFL